jgi:ABC-2 type transport system permease protein
MMWPSVWAVIRREYLQRVRSKWFIIGTVGGPVFMAAMIFIPAYFAARGEMNERNIALVDRTEVLYEGLAPRLEQAGYTVSQEAWSDDVVEALTQRVMDDELGGFMILDDMTLTAGEASFHASSRPSAIRSLSLRQALVAAALEVQLRDAGVDAAAMLSGGALDVTVLSESATDNEAQLVAAAVGAFFLYMVILLYSVSVMRATLEEKTNRVVEIIVSSMKPWYLMLGKILGVGAVGLTQMAVWVLSAAILMSTALPMVIAARPELAELQNVQAALPGLGMLFLFLGFFVFGFFMFSGMYGAVGAMVSSDEEAQQAQFPVTMMVIVPMLFITPVLSDPSSNLSTGLSLFPLFSPIIMWIRVASGAAPWWQVGVSFVLMALTVLAIAWVAGRIYKVGILMTGKRPTLPELLRWVREA